MNMAAVTLGKLTIDPVKNPAVLDTATWNPRGAWKQIQRLDGSYWKQLRRAAESERTLPSRKGFNPYRGSCSCVGKTRFLLAELEDSQLVFVSIGADVEKLGEPVGSKSFSDELRVAVYKTDAPVVDRFFRMINPDKGSRALGPVPRLGIGCRMSTAIWPAVWPAMQECGFAANAIQNSLRELNLLEDLLEGRPPKINYQFSFGSIQEGHTGSTFEGLWLAGVLDALKSETRPVYGADADHIMVKRDPSGVERAKRIIEAARFYTFYTMDVSDILDYEALFKESASAAEIYLTETIESETKRREILTYHTEKRRIAGERYAPDEKIVGFLIGKYWRALEAVQELYNHLKTLKEGIPFDLELSIDETPPDVSTYDSLTSSTELVFLLLEAKRREIPLTHVAPNFGVEKGVDYRQPDGLGGLERRMRNLCRIAEEWGIMLDCHSGDDLESPTRKTIGKASEGNIHFKISPSLQVMFAEVLHRLYPERFLFWWEDSLSYARKEAKEGSEFARQCLEELEKSEDPSPSPRHSVFHHFNFATVGRRDTQGRFIHRDKFYILPEDFYREYQAYLKDHLCRLVGEVLHRSGG
jgi:hypothetical protein